MSTEPYVKWSYQTGSYGAFHGAAVSNVDGDDTMEVVIRNLDGKVYCLNGLTGVMKWSYTVGACFDMSASVADIDMDVLSE